MLKMKNYICISFLLAVALLLTVPVACAESVAKSAAQRPIAAYGEDAKAFASLITQYETAANNVVVVSDLKNTDVKALENAMENGGIIVAVNLPVGNALVSVPAVEKTSQRELLRINTEDNSVQTIRSSKVSIEMLYPNYWITVIQKDSRKDFMLIEVDSTELRDELSLKAADAVGEAVQTLLLTLDGDTGYDHWDKKREYMQAVKFGTDQKDEFYIRHEIYELDVWDPVTNKEYWRTDSWIDSKIPEYGCWLLHVGPYIKHRQIIVDASSAADLYLYSPITTPVDVGVNVGISFSTGGVSLNFGWSWTNAGVNYDVDGSYANSKVITDEYFREADYTWYPFIIEPTPNSHSSYLTQMTNVMRTPVGSGYELDELGSKWWIYDDWPVYWGGIFYYVYRNSYSYRYWWNPSHITSTFS